MLRLELSVARSSRFPDMNVSSYESICTITGWNDGIAGWKFLVETARMASIHSADVPSSNTLTRPYQLQRCCCVASSLLSSPPAVINEVQCVHLCSNEQEFVLHCGYWRHPAAVVETRQQADAQRCKLLVFILFWPPHRQKMSSLS